MTTCIGGWWSDAYGICGPEGSGSNVATAPGPGTASAAFAVPAAGSYRLWARVAARDDASDSLWVRVDGGAWAAAELGTYAISEIDNEWVWRPLLGPVALTAGSHSVAIGVREDGRGVEAFREAETGHDTLGEEALVELDPLVKLVHLGPERVELIHQLLRHARAQVPIPRVPFDDEPPLRVPLATPVLARDVVAHVAGRAHGMVVDAAARELAPVRVVDVLHRRAQPRFDLAGRDTYKYDEVPDPKDGTRLPSDGSPRLTPSDVGATGGMSSIMKTGRPSGDLSAADAITSP